MTEITNLQQAAEPQVSTSQVSVMTQLVFRTQFVRLGQNNAVPVVSPFTPWAFPGLGHMAIGEKGRGTVLAVIFSTTVVASASFFIAGEVNWGLCGDEYDKALAEVEFTTRSNHLFLRDRYYNRFKVLASYGEASLAAAVVVYAYSIFDYYYSRKRLSGISFYPSPGGAELAYRRKF
jgi:hypothetical protein